MLTSCNVSGSTIFISSYSKSQQLMLLSQVNQENLPCFFNLKPNQTKPFFRVAIHSTFLGLVFTFVAVLRLLSFWRTQNVDSQNEVTFKACVSLNIFIVQIFCCLIIWPQSASRNIGPCWSIKSNGYFLLHPGFPHSSSVIIYQLAFLKKVIIIVQRV